jgi:hypothetical protein
MVNELMAALVEQLAGEVWAGDADRALTERLPLAVVWADLARLTGETPPAWAGGYVDRERGVGDD